MRKIDGYREIHRFLNGTRLIAAEEFPADFKADMLVIETDTYRVLDADTGYRNVDEHPVRIFTKALDDAPMPPGSIITRRKAPLCLQVVVYDFDRDPICRPEWIRAAWRKIFLNADRAKCRSLATPLLGQKDPALSFRLRAELFRTALADAGAAISCVWMKMIAEERRQWHAVAIRGEN